MIGYFIGDLFRFDWDRSQLVIYYGYQFGFDEHLDDLLHPACGFNCGLVEEKKHKMSSRISAILTFL
jgi:hypothetical protein